MTTPSAEPLDPLKQIEAFAPYAAGGLLLGCGAWALAQTIAPKLGLGFLPTGPLDPRSIPTALIVGGAGAGVLLAAWEKRRMESALKTAEATASRSQAERDLALRQARRLRAQSEGLALMREVHRATAIPDRHDRLQRILTLVSDLFEAREVTLFAAQPDQPTMLIPAAHLKTSPVEELFVAFEPAAFERSSGSSSGMNELPKVKDAALACEGYWLFVEGSVMSGDKPLARAQWRRALAGYEQSAPRQDPNTMLEAALAGMDCGPQACREAAHSLEKKRTLRQVEASDKQHEHGEESLLLSVPLVTGQRTVGSLRIRRLAEGFDGPEAEAVEELLFESAKHLALAMKKDEDDRKAITDQLTGLFIKRHFLAVLEELRAQVAGSHSGAGTPAVNENSFTRAAIGSGSGTKSFALVLSDIDHFKKVNDTHGHLSGDMVLKECARVLRTGLRTGDMAFRYGGEEMAVLMPGATQEAAEQMAERLRTAIQGHTFLGEKGQVIPVTISMGIAMHRPGLTGEQLISRSDRALYSSKHNGRNRVTPWSAELPDPLKKKE